ncbi:hypothetical protein AAK917_12405 [Oscillospiraceae bacterium 52-8]
MWRLLIPCELVFVALALYYLYGTILTITAKLSRTNPSKPFNWKLPFNFLENEALSKLFGDFSQKTLSTILIASAAVGLIVLSEAGFSGNHVIGSFFEGSVYSDIYPGLEIRTYNNGNIERNYVCMYITKEDFAYKLEDYFYESGTSIEYDDYIFKHPVGKTLEIDYGNYISELTLLDNEPGTPTEWYIIDTEETQESSQDNKDNSNQNLEMVWVTEAGKKYHKISSCSNMKDPQKITLQQALDDGKTKCSRCW